MENIFRELNITINEKQIESFEKYYEMLIFYNEKFNITAITDKKEVYIKHFADSLTGSEFIKGKRLIDVGAGGGFPSLPLLITHADMEGTLVEATEKKCGFLREVVKELSLNKVEVICDRAEILAKNPKYREKYDVCVARAVAKLNTLCEYCMPFVQIGGSFIAYKGDASEEIKEAENAIKTLGGKSGIIKSFDFYGAKRTIIEIIKIIETEKKYPRGNGKERKNPL